MSHPDPGAAWIMWGIGWALAVAFLYYEALWGNPPEK
jgi:hypothetical protein